MITKKELWDILREIDGQAPIKELVESDPIEPLPTTDIWLEHFFKGEANYVLSNL